jgi:hypothetical protein
MTVALSTILDVDHAPTAEVDFNLGDEESYKALQETFPGIPDELLHNAHTVFTACANEITRLDRYSVTEGSDGTPDIVFLENGVCETTNTLTITDPLRPEVCTHEIPEPLDLD